MPVGMAVGLGPGDFVFNGDPATPRKKGTPMCDVVRTMDSNIILMWHGCKL